MLILGLLDVQLEYLAEGAANVVYRIRPPDMNSDPSTAADLQFENYEYDSDTPLPSEISPLQLDPQLKGKLVRLRKHLPHAMPVEDTQWHFETIIRPLFRKENLIESELFQMSPSLLEDCNSKLRKMEKSDMRPAKRWGVYLTENPRYGCLITDMTWLVDDTIISLEFKPKWLVQSPTAPAGSKRCRSCALRAMKRVGFTNQPETLNAGSCPLNLMSSDKTKIKLFLDYVMESNSKRPSQDVQRRLIDFLYQNTLLERVKRLQLDLDPHGVFRADLMSSDFLAAMTLRDCSLFLRVSRHDWFQEKMTTAKNFLGAHGRERCHRSSSRRPRPKDVTWKEGRLLAKHREEANRRGLVHSDRTRPRKT